MADPGNEEQGLLSRPAMETCLESLRLLEASPVSSPPSPTDLPEPRGTMEHTNNRIGESACLGGPGVLRGQWEMDPEPLTRDQRPWGWKAQQGRDRGSPPGFYK